MTVQFRNTPARCTWALSALVAALALSTNAHAWQDKKPLTPEEREALRKKIEEQLKDDKKKAPAPLSSDQKDKLLDDLRKRTDSQIQPPRERAARNSGSSVPFRKMNTTVLAAFKDVVTPVHKSTVTVKANGKDAAL